MALLKRLAVLPITILLSLCALLLAPLAAAETVSSIQSYDADPTLQTGTIVQLDESNSAKVIAATQSKLDKMFGVTVNPDDQAVTLSGGSSTQTFVATAGKYDVLVSTQNGVIKTGDLVTVSSLDGIAMKASDKQTIVFGKALANFDGKSSAIGSVVINDTDGNPYQTVSLGRIPVAINIVHNPNVKNTKANLPKQLERIGEAIAQKPLSPFRIYLSAAIALLCVIVALVMLYAGVRNSFISIGRNPLSKKSIFRGLLEVILTSALVLIIGLFAVYLLLRL